MRMLLLHQDIAVAKAVVDIHCSFFDVREVSVFKRQELPNVFLRKLSADTTPEECLTEWLLKRQIPNNRYNLDHVISSFLKLKKNLFGRLYGYQLIPAFLSGFASKDDHYVLVPETKGVFFCGLSDERIPNLYFLEPEQFLNDLCNLRQVQNRTEHGLYINPYDRILLGDKTGSTPTGMFASFSYTITDRIPSICIAQDGAWTIKRQTMP